MTILANEFRAGMRQLAAAVNIITTLGDNGRAGMTATAVVSLTAEPPQLGVAVNRTNASYAAMRESRVFAVNVLSHDKADLAGQFAGSDGKKGEERFADGAVWNTLHTGAPILMDSAASFDCELVQQVEFSSHVLMVGVVKAIRVEPTTTPLLYMDGAWASLVHANKADFEAYGQLVDEVADDLEQALAEDEQPRMQLRRFVHSFSTAHAAKANVLRDFFSRETFAPARRLDAINLRKRQIEATLHGVLRRGAETGEFDIADPGLAANAIIGMLNSVHRWPDGRPHADPSTIGDRFDVLIRAMTGQSAA